MNPDLTMNRPGNPEDYGQNVDASLVINPPSMVEFSVAMGLQLVAKSMGMAYQLLGKETALVAFAEGACRGMFANGMKAGDIEAALKTALERTCDSIEAFNADKGGVRTEVSKIIAEEEAKRKDADAIVREAEKLLDQLGEAEEARVLPFRNKKIVVH